MILVESYKSACKDYAASFLKNNCMDILLYKPANCDCCKPQPVPVWEAYIRNFYSIIPASINLKFVNLFNDKNVSTLALSKHIRAYFDRNKKFEDILTYSSWLINRNQEIFGTKTKKQAFESMKEDVVSNLILLMHYDHVSRWQIRFIDSNRYVVEDDLDLPLSEFDCFIENKQLYFITPKEALFVRNMLKDQYSKFGEKLPKTEICGFNQIGQKVDWYVVPETVTPQMLTNGCSHE